MLGLPSTTEVGQRIPKEAFYRNMKVTARERDQFVSGVEDIIVANDIKLTTTNVLDGERVHEIIVLSVVPKGMSVPDKVLEVIERANKSKILYSDAGDGSLAIVLSGKVKRFRRPPEKIELRGKNLDEAWESIVAQVAFGDLNGTDVFNRLEVGDQIQAVEERIAKLEPKMRKERQTNKRNEMFYKLKDYQEELAVLENKAQRWKRMEQD